MVRPLMALEGFFERLLERPAARLFRVPLQPVQLERRLDRAMDLGRRLSADRTYAPNRYTVRLSPHDAPSFAGYRDTLEADLAAGVARHARERGYALVERPVVVLREDVRLGRGVVAVDAAFETVAAPTALPGGPAAAVDGRTAILPIVDEEAAPTPLTLVVREPGCEPRALRLTRVMRLGRGADNDVVLADGGVSRVHGRLAPRHGTWVFQDLGSSNGSFLNGYPVTEAVLGLGDELRLGGTVLMVGPDR
ncbi:MAG TPA: DUF3662 and FHA domain-containing protein [Candidatus Sulfotelmatobacter sp.]|nr:DUF3662 and FHA domain-containing protein [Candidatus Sulfotelmatobacter sp.]